MFPMRFALRASLAIFTFAAAGLMIPQQAEAQWMYGAHGLSSYQRGAGEGRFRTATSEGGRFARSTTSDRRLGIYSTGGGGIVPGGYGYYRPYVRPFRPDAAPRRR